MSKNELSNINNLSIEFIKRHGKSYNTLNLLHLRQFYMTYQKLYSLRRESAWIHYRLLIKIDEQLVIFNKICYYIYTSLSAMAMVHGLSSSPTRVAISRLKEL